MPPTDEDVAWFQSTFHPIPKPSLPDDCIEYSLYIISPSLDSINDSELRLRLRDVQKRAADLQKQYLKDYIWQRQGLSLELNKEDGLSFLRGRTEYGDSVEDEWVIVWVLRELTRMSKDIWVKVTDSDGEFLLIEASETLPAWLEPDVAENRVWINDGDLKIIKPASNARTSKRTEEKLALREARQILLTQPKRLMHSTIMQEEAFYRLRNYPNQIVDNMHHAILSIPRTVAFLLHQKPAYIAPVVEAFYLRDPIALKPLQTVANRDKMNLKPEDFVTVSVKFPKVCYAQLKSQDFPPPAVFNNILPSRTDQKLWPQAESGMKVTCGFEMLVTDSQFQDRPAVREIKLLLEDLESGDETLPTDNDIASWTLIEDDEKWLDVNFDDLDNELKGSKGAQASSGNGAEKKGGFGDKAAQENLRRIVRQFEDFLNDDKAGLDGANMFDDDSSVETSDEDEDDEGEDKDASFSEDDFTKMMQEMMGMPPEVMKEIMSGKLGSGATDPGQRSNLRSRSSGKARVVETTESESDDDQGDDDMQTFMRQMEAELRPTGVLDLSSSSTHAAIGDSVSQTSPPRHDEEDVVNELSSDDDGDNDIDINLARNLLESLKSQGGTSGPGGNLMGMLGLGMLPRDEADMYEVEDDEVQAGPSDSSKRGT
ncbi:hypothetical protein PV10_00038 [Exophiala mesophila]|uniref:Regulatory factor Sgt1 n=1 Tax=Exophiala mesophila TaxID=212818 RepID=A0A0D1ZQ97_EXOME|nr:uncharacterized protein PV10_00038 [Exophiala mesophila]KIV96134.1 hypothetical protein PV10_00038 [Exophiala mesophila]